MRRLYTLLLILALPVASLVVLWRGVRERAYWQGWAQRFGLGAPLPGDGPGLWVHAVSVGEVQAAASLLAALRSGWPAAPLVVTSATPTGRARAFSFGPEVAARYAPYDLPWCVRAALRRFRPAMLVIIETELWPNLLNECQRAGVPVLIVSARLSERSTRRWQRARSLLHPALATGVTVAAQSAADASRFAALGVPAQHIRVCGNIKFDRTAAPSVRANGQALRERYAAHRPMWVAGSTRPGEEQIALSAHAALRAKRPDALLVLAPRHTPRFDEVATLLERSGLPWSRHSTGGGAAASGEIAVLLVDTLGELENFYAASDVAFVGGSLVPVGGHNLLEPAALGVPVLTGWHHENAPDIARLLKDNHAIRMVSDGAQLGQELIRLLGDPAERSRLTEAALATLAENRGALERVLGMISASLAARVPGSVPSLAHR